MKNKPFTLKLTLILIVLLLIRLMVSLKTIKDDSKLFKIGQDAIVAFNDNEIKNTNRLLKQSDELYASSKFLRKITLNFNDSHQYINTSYTLKGRIALKNNQIELAKNHLIQSANIKSTPALSSFGPSMALAKDLLEIGGESKIVVEYLDNCKLFWEGGNGQLNKWKEQIQNGNIPEFGANLRY